MANLLYQGTSATQRTHSPPTPRDTETTGFGLAQLADISSTLASTTNHKVEDPKSVPSFDLPVAPHGDGQERPQEPQATGIGSLPSYLSLCQAGYVPDIFEPRLSKTSVNQVLPTREAKGGESMTPVICDPTGTALEKTEAQQRQEHRVPSPSPPSGSQNWIRMYTEALPNTLPREYNSSTDYHNPDMASAPASYANSGLIIPGSHPGYYDFASVGVPMPMFVFPEIMPISISSTEPSRGQNPGRGQSPTRSERKPERKHPCKICQKAFKRPSSLRAHYRHHTGEKPFLCEFPGCSRSVEGNGFSVLSNMKRHMTTVHRLSDWGSPDSTSSQDSHASRTASLSMDSWGLSSPTQTGTFPGDGRHA